MTPEALSEQQARELLNRLGYVSAPQPILPGANDREGRSAAVIDRERVLRALRRLNPGLAESELRRAHRQLLGALRGEGMPWMVEGARTQALLRGGLLLPGQVRPLRLLDFSRLHNNELSLHGPGEDGWLVLAMNGLPLAVLTLSGHARAGEPVGEQAFLKAQDTAEVGGLPTTVGVLAAVAIEESCIGAPLAMPHDMLSWPECYPLPASQLAGFLGRPPTHQDTLLLSALSPTCLLELTHHFLQTEDQHGVLVLRLARQHQFIAVQRALARLRSRRGARVGLIRHREGSGRTRTLLWLAMRLLRAEAHDGAVGRRLLLISEQTQVSARLAAACVSAGLPPPVPVGEAALRIVLHAAAPGDREAALWASADALRDALPTGDQTAGEGLVLIMDEPSPTLALLLRRRLPAAAMLTVSGAPAPADPEEARVVAQSLGPELHRYPPAPSRVAAPSSPRLPRSPSSLRRTGRPPRSTKAPADSEMARELARLLADTLPPSLAADLRPSYGAPPPPLQELARLLEEDLRALLVVDWATREDVQRQMRLTIKQRLRSAAVGAPGVHLDVLTVQVLALCRLRLR